MKSYRIAKVYKKELLPVSDLHSIYVEQSGNPKGVPVIRIHGGPGSYSKPKHRKVFNPIKYRIILFDQRGCGKSTPQGETKENSTKNIIEDIEKIRIHLGIEKWIVYGTSWGSTLALYYAEKHPDQVFYLIVGGVFTFTKFELDWFEKEGANWFYPDNFEKYRNFIPKNERGNLPRAYAKRILGIDKKDKLKQSNLPINGRGVFLRLLKKARIKKIEEKIGTQDDLTYPQKYFSTTSEITDS
jgi:proline iminopeptidase